MKLRDISGACAAIRESLDFEAVLDEYGLAYEQRARRTEAICPFHDDHEPSLHVQRDKLLYYCHACKAGGDVFDFVREVESCALPDAVERLAPLAGVDLSPYCRDLTREEKARLAYSEAYDGLLSLAEWSADQSPLDDWAESRRLDPSVLRAYGAVYSGAWGAVRDSAQNAPAAAEVNRRELFNDTILFPLRDDRGATVGLRARALSGRVKAIGPTDSHPMELPAVYGLDLARKAVRETGHLILVEGEVDMWQMVYRGWPQTCALLGSHLPKETFRWLAERSIREVVLMPDADEAGRRMVSRVVAMGDTHGVRVRVATLPYGDPDEVLLTEPELVQESIAGAIWAVEWEIRARTRGLPDPIAALDKCADFVVSLGEAEKEIAAGVLAEVCDISPRAVLDHYLESHAGEEGDLFDPVVERDVVAACLHDPEAMGEAASRIADPSVFRVPKYFRLWTVLRSMFADKEEIAPETLRVRLRASAPEDVGHADSLWGHRPSSGAVSSLVGALLDMKLRRDLLQESSRMRGEVFDRGKPARESAVSAVSRLSSAAMGDQSTVAHAADLSETLMMDAHERVLDPKVIIGLDLGEDMYTLNRAIHGFQAGRHMVMAAPSGVGKTMFASGVARRVGIELGIPTLVMTFETGDLPYAKRMVCSMAGVEQEKVTTGFMSPEELDRVGDAAARFAASPIAITRAGRYIEDAEAIVRHDVMRRGTQLVIFDYVQLMYTREGSRLARHEQIGLISGAMLDMAGALGIRTLALAQINREGAKKARSSMEDIGGAFKIAQDADIFIIMDEKPEAEVEAEGLQSGNRVCVVPKNRVDGRSGFGFNLMADTLTQSMKEVKS